MSKFHSWLILISIMVIHPALSHALPTVPNVMGALLRQKVSPQNLWQKGRLNGDLLVKVLNEKDWEKKENKSIANQLCALLVKNAPEKLKNPIALPPRTRLRLAQYFRSIKDPRTVTFYEAIISQIKTPQANSVNAVLELSYYYDAIGDLQKSAETCLRMKDYSTSVEGIANATLQAARLYRDNGDTEKSQALYHKAENSGYGWVDGVALWDEGYIAMGKGKYAEAREILSKPVTGKYADQAKVLLLSAMAVSYDRENNFEQTRKYAKLCFDQYDSLKFHLSKDSGIESQVGVVKSMLYWIDQWEKLPVPVLVQPKEFIRDFPAGDQPIMQQIGVYSKLPITITVESDNKKVEILSTSKKAERTAGFFLNYSQLRIPRENVKGTINIRSPQYPKWVEHVKINVMIQKDSGGQDSPGKAIIK